MVWELCLSQDCHSNMDFVVMALQFGDLAYCRGASVLAGSSVAICYFRLAWVSRIWKFYCELRLLDPLAWSEPYLWDYFRHTVTPIICNGLSRGKKILSIQTLKRKMLKDTCDLGSTEGKIERIVSYSCCNLLPSVDWECFQIVFPIQLSRFHSS